MLPSRQFNLNSFLQKCREMRPEYFIVGKQKRDEKGRNIISVSLKRDNTSNFVCPITLTSQFNSGEFYFARNPNSGHFVCFDAASLIDYILATGDSCDPESRMPFAESDLKRLDEISIALGKGSILDALKVFNKVEAQLFQNALFGLERMCGEVVANLYDVVELCNEGKRTFGESMDLIKQVIIPDLKDLLCQLLLADFAFGNQSLKTWEIFLRGPPNHRVENTVIQQYAMESFQKAVTEARNVSREE